MTIHSYESESAMFYVLLILILFKSTHLFLFGGLACRCLRICTLFKLSMGSSKMRLYTSQFLLSPTLLSILTVLLSLSGLRKAFFPVDWRGNAFGNGGTSHESQTRDIFTELAGKFFGIYDLTGSMINAQRTIITANAQVDFPVGYQPHEHFDNEQFNAGHALLNERRNAVKKALEEGDAAEARNAVGKALHTLQDFYAHSNWIEMNDAKGVALTTYTGLGISDSFALF